MNTAEKWHGTTIVLLRKNNETVVAGDGQVSLGNTVLKSKAKKVRKIESRGVIVENIRKQKSYMLPFASSRPKLKKNINIALIGDASSMINPISGEGIFYGMEAGYLLAKNTNELVRSEELSSGILKYEKEFSNRFRKHYLSCALARLILQSPFMTKRLLKVASKDQDTIDFVIELLFDEAYLTLSEVIKISYKFLIPTRLLAFISKN